MHDVKDNKLDETANGITFKAPRLYYYKYDSIYFNKQTKYQNEVIINPMKYKNKNNLTSRT